MQHEDEFFAVIENYDGEAVGLFDSMSSAKNAIKEHARVYSIECGGDVACLEFKVFKIKMSTDKPYKVLMAEFSGIELTER